VEAADAGAVSWRGHENPVAQTSEAAEKLGFGVILSEAKNLSSI
jgi:hypothetical protein